MPSGSPPTERIGVVTGGSSGIGKEIARGLAVRGWRVAIVGRDPERTAATATEIAAATSNPNVDVVLGGDLAVRANAQSLAGQLLGRYPKIHLLVNNAGAYFRRREATSDGLERTFALNVLAPYELTTQLADRLVASAPARVVNISSAAHLGRTVNFADLQSEHQYSGFEVYGESKLELVLLTREFARRFAGTGVTVNAVHPGFVASGFAQNNGGGQAFIIRILGRLFGKSVRRGAEGPLRLATDPTLVSTTGQYFSGLHEAPGSAESQDRASAERLFQTCAQIAGVGPLAPFSASAV